MKNPMRPGAFLVYYFIATVVSLAFFLLLGLFGEARAESPKPPNLPHTLGTMANDAGGNIIFSLTECTAPKGGWVAITYAASGKTHFGCWKLAEDGSLLAVRWDTDKSISIYPIESLVISDTAQRLYDESKKRERF